MRLAVIAGDGIGKEVTAEAVKVLTRAGEAFGRRFEFEHLPWGADYFLETGITLPPNGYAMLRDDFDAIFIGALGDPRVPDNRHAREILLGTRFELDLYVNLRPVKLLDDRLTPLKNRTRADVDFVVFRENTEGLYVSVGGRFKAGTDDEIAIQEELNTFKGVNRIIRHAFEFARERGLTKVCMADKSNAMQQGHALWQRVFKQTAAEIGVSQVGLAQIRFAEASAAEMDRGEVGLLQISFAEVCAARSCSPTSWAAMSWRSH